MTAATAQMVSDPEKILAEARRRQQAEAAAVAAAAAAPSHGASGSQNAIEGNVAMPPSSSRAAPAPPGAGPGSGSVINLTSPLVTSEGSLASGRPVETGIAAAARPMEEGGGDLHHQGAPPREGEGEQGAGASPPPAAAFNRRLLVPPALKPVDPRAVSAAESLLEELVKVRWRCGQCTPPCRGY